MGNMGLTQVPAPSPLLAWLLELFWSKSHGNAVHPSPRPTSCSSQGFLGLCPCSLADGGAQTDFPSFSLFLSLLTEGSVVEKKHTKTIITLSFSSPTLHRTDIKITPQ